MSLSVGSIKRSDWSRDLLHIVKFRKRMQFYEPTKGEILFPIRKNGVPTPWMYCYILFFDKPTNIWYKFGIKLPTLDDNANLDFFVAEIGRGIHEFEERLKVGTATKVTEGPID